jgi:hypothetical protein
MIAAKTSPTSIFTVYTCWERSWTPKLWSCGWVMLKKPRLTVDALQQKGLCPSIEIGLKVELNQF